MPKKVSRSEPSMFDIIVDDQGREKAVFSDYYKKYVRRQELLINLKDAHIPQHIADYDIETYIGPDEEKNVPALKNFLRQYPNYRNVSLFFCGIPGTQKSTLSWWIGREVLKQGYSVQYVFMNDLVKLLTAESFDEEKTDYIQSLYDCDLLIIDRVFQKEQVTIYRSGYQLSFLDNFLRKRIELLDKGILFISNVELSEISSQGFTEDMQDFIIRNTRQATFTFKDRYTLKDDFEVANIFKK